MSNFNAISSNSNHRFVNWNSFNGQAQTLNSNNNITFGGLNQFNPRLNRFDSNWGLGQPNGLISQLSSTNTTTTTFSNQFTFENNSTTWVSPPQQRVQVISNTTNTTNTITYLTPQNQYSTMPTPLVVTTTTQKVVERTQFVDTFSTSGNFLGHYQNPLLRNSGKNVAHQHNNLNPLSVIFPHGHQTMNQNNIVAGDQGNSSVNDDDDKYDGRTHSFPYKKYGPYTCPKCKGVFEASQAFAAHVGSHYKSETAEQRRKRHLAKAMKKKIASLRKKKNSNDNNNVVTNANE